MMFFALFVLLISTLTNAAPTCSAELDIVLSLDGSGSISPENFALMLQFCAKLAQTFNFSATGVRMGAVQFSSVLQTEFQLTSSQSDAVTKINNIKKLIKTGTNIAGGIDIAQKVLESSPRASATKTILLITDGRQSVAGDPIASANNVKAKNVQLFIVGVGRAINAEVLTNLASEPKQSHYFQITNFDGLAAIFNSIASNTCPEYTCDSVSPTYGPASGGTVVTIKGNHLTGKAGDLQCMFGSKVVPAIQASPSSIQCTTPAGINGQSVPLQISLDGGKTWLNQNCQFSYSLFKPDLCEKWSTNCSFCISHPLCGWCSVNVTRDDGTQGSQCAGFNKTGGEQPFTCVGTFNTQQCTKGYFCDITTATCKLDRPGNGVDQKTCRDGCGNGMIYRCVKENNTCLICENGTPGCVSHLECFNDCAIPFAPTPNTPADPGTPVALIGTIWRGININKNYTSGEMQLKFGVKTADIWVVRSKTLLSFTTSSSDGGDVLWLTDKEGKTYKCRMITNYVGEVVAVTIARGIRGGVAPSTFDESMTNPLMQTHIFGKCLNSATCSFHWDGPAALKSAPQQPKKLLKREVNENDYCMNFTTCTPCINEPTCGWCSNNVIYNDGTIGKNCAGFNPQGGKKPFVCSGTFSSDSCAIAPKTYECEPRSKKCIISQPGAGTDLKTCENFCARPLPPADNVTPIALQGYWRGLQIQDGYVVDEFTALFGETNGVISKDGTALISGDVQSVEDQIWIQTAHGIIRGKWQISYGPETAMIGLAFGPVAGPPPFDFAEAMQAKGYSEFFFASCLPNKITNGICAFDSKKIK